MTSTASQYMGANAPAPAAVEWDGRRYAANTAHHRAHDGRFLAPLRLRGDETVLDIGCGSGDFTRTVAGLVPDGHVVGIDPQPSMLDLASGDALPNQSFRRLAAQDIGVAFDASSFDVVISRATLHWVPAADHPSVLAGAARVLRPSGTLRLEMGGAGNIVRTQALLDEISGSLGGPIAPWCFHDAGGYLDLLDEAGFVVDDGDVITVAQRRSFDREGFDGWLDSQVILAYDSGLSADGRVELRRRVAERAEEFRRPDGSYDQTYVRLEVLAQRPG